MPRQWTVPSFVHTSHLGVGLRHAQAPQKDGTFMPVRYGRDTRGQGDPARAQARRRLPVGVRSDHAGRPAAADEPGDAAQVEPGIVEGRPVGVRHDGGAARCCGEDVRDAWCASGRTSQPPSRPSISSSPVRSPAGVTGKSSLATADAPGNTDRPRWPGVKCVTAEGSCDPGQIIARLQVAWHNVIER
jgi:hypothetical protein